MGLAGDLPCLAGDRDWQCHGQRGRAGSPQGQAGMVHKKEVLIHPHRRAGSSSGTARRPESHLCRARPPSPTSPAGKEQLPLVETPHLPWWDMFFMRSSVSQLTLVMSRGSGTSKPGTETLGCPGDVGAHRHSKCCQPGSLGSTSHQRNPTALLPVGLVKCGVRVAELVQAAWLYPSQPFLPPCAEGAVSILTLTHVGCRSHTHLQSHYKITSMEAGAHQIRP